MDQLKAFLRSLPDEEARERFAAECETTLGHLRNVCYGKPASPMLAALVETNSGAQVRRWHMRPDDWHRIWPEVVGADGAPPV